MKKLLVGLLLSLPSIAMAKQVDLMLEWFVNPDHASIVVAKQKGFFAEQGLQVNILEPSDPALPPKMVSVGKVDYATHYQNSLQLQTLEGFNNVRVGTIIGQPLDTIMTLQGNGIETIADLKGKKVGFAVAGGISEAIIGTMLKHNGLSLDDVELVNVNWQIVQSLVSKQVDATMGGYRNFTLPELEQAGFVGKPFFPEEHGVPSFEELILIANKNNAASEETRGLVKAINKAVTYIKENPQASWEVFKAYKPDVLDNQLNKNIWQLTYPLLADDTAALNKKVYLDNAKFLYDNKIVEEPLPALDTYAIDPLQ